MASSSSSPKKTCHELDETIHSRDRLLVNSPHDELKNKSRNFNMRLGENSEQVNNTNQNFVANGIPPLQRRDIYTRRTRSLPRIPFSAAQDSSRNVQSGNRTSSRSASEGMIGCEPDGGNMYNLDKSFTEALRDDISLDIGDAEAAENHEADGGDEEGAQDGAHDDNDINSAIESCGKSSPVGPEAKLGLLSIRSKLHQKQNSQLSEKRESAESKRAHSLSQALNLAHSSTGRSLSLRSGRRRASNECDNIITSRLVSSDVHPCTGSVIPYPSTRSLSLTSSRRRASNECDNVIAFRSELNEVPPLRKSVLSRALNCSKSPVLCKPLGNGKVIRNVSFSLNCGKEDEANRIKNPVNDGGNECSDDNVRHHSEQKFQVSLNLIRKKGNQNESFCENEGDVCTSDKRNNFDRTCYSGNDNAKPFLSFEPNKNPSHLRMKAPGTPISPAVRAFAPSSLPSSAPSFAQSPGAASQGPPPTLSPSPLPHLRTALPKYDLGDEARKIDHMVVEANPLKAFKNIHSLEVHDFAFIKRSDGRWTYAIIANFYNTNESNEKKKGDKTRAEADAHEPSIRFVVDNKGATKSFRLKNCFNMIRLVNTNIASNTKKKNGAAVGRSSAESKEVKKSKEPKKIDRPTIKMPTGTDDLICKKIREEKSQDSEVDKSDNTGMYMSFVSDAAVLSNYDCGRDRKMHKDDLARRDVPKVVSTLQE